MLVLPLLVIPVLSLLSVLVVLSLVSVLGVLSLAVLPLIAVLIVSALWQREGLPDLEVDPAAQLPGGGGQVVQLSRRPDALLVGAQRVVPAVK